MNGKKSTFVHVKCFAMTMTMVTKIEYILDLRVLGDKYKSEK